MSDYAPSAFWSYVRPGELCTCDERNVTQRAARLERVQLHGKLLDRCRDKVLCAKWKAQLAKAAPR